MDREQAAKLQARIAKLRALEHDGGATPSESASAKTNADRLQARLDTEYQPGEFTFRTPGYVHGARHWTDDEARWRQANAAHWADIQESYQKLRRSHYSQEWLNIYTTLADNDNITVSEEYNDNDIVEEDFRHDDEDGDW